MKVLTGMFIFLALMLAPRLALFPGEMGKAIRFEHLTIRDGLSQSTVFCVCRDSRGFIWIGTEDGLNRYDGFNFEVFRHDPEDPGSIGDSFINTIYEDSKGRLWIGARSKGLNLYDRRHNRFIHYRPDPKNPSSISIASVFSILEDSRGIFWVGGNDGGLNRFDPESGVFSHYRARPGQAGYLQDDAVAVIYEFPRGTLWLGAWDGRLHRFNPDTGWCDLIWTSDTAAPGNTGDRVFALQHDRSGNLWMGSRNSGLFRINPQTLAMKNFRHDPANPRSISQNSVTSLLEDADGRIWAGTLQNGLNILEQGAQNFRRYTADPDDPWSLSHDGVISLYRDKTGITWVGTWGNGLSKWDPGKWKFQHVSCASEGKTGRTPTQVWSFYRDRAGEFWVGTDAGLNRLDETTGRLTLFKSSDVHFSRFQRRDVRSILEDSQGNFWIGSMQGLALFNRRSRQFRFFRHNPLDPHSISNDGVIKVIEDKAGRIWAATQGGVNLLLNATENRFRRYVPESGDPHSLSHNEVMDIMEDRRGEFWIATLQGGINHFNPESGHFRHYRHDPRRPDSLNRDNTRMIIQDKKGVIWIATMGGGVNRFTPSTGKFSAFTKREGLANNVVYAIMEDDRGGLWMSTNSGLSFFNPETQSFRNFDVSDGLQSNEFNGGAAYRDADGRLFFGGINGFNAFFPEQIPVNPCLPPIVITSFKKFNREFPLPVDITELDELHLSYKDSVFSFEFAGLCFTDPGKNRYAYRLLGFQDQWISLGHKRDITFTNLLPGRYTLQIKGSNNDNQWNEEGKTLVIHVAGPFWGTWQFKIILIFLAAAILTAAHFMRTRKIQRLNDMLEQQVSERTRELRESEEKYRNLVEHARDGIIIVQDNRLKYLNPQAATLLGHSFAELLGTSFPDIIHPDERDRLILHHQRKLAGENLPEVFETLLLDKNGRCIDVEFSETWIVPPPNPTVMIIIHDLREHKSLERERSKSEKLEAIGILAGGIAHDFNNLLAVILGNINLARISIDAGDSAELIHNLLARSEKASLMASNLSAQFITFSVGGEPIKRRLDLPSLLKDLTEHILEKQHLDLRLRIQDGLSPICCDSEQIFQIFNNLIANARDAIRDKAGGFIDINVKNRKLMDNEVPTLLAGDYVQTSVTDNGPGIPEENLQLIFDPYFSTKNEFSRKGMGLGLSIAYSIARKHGGTVVVTSGLVKGASFDVFLPAADSNCP